jgi:putative peptidoglycan lipid II flippase
VGHIVRTMAPASIGLAAMQVNVFVNTHFAAQLAEGTQALMQCAFRLFYLPVGVFGVALAVVTTSRVAEDAARGDSQALRDRTAEGGRAVWMLALGSAVGLIVLAEPVLTVLFERGMFGPTEVRDTVPILRAYMLGVLPYSLVKIYAPAFYALGAARITMIASMTAVAANIVWSAFTYTRLGATGLAFGTTVAAVVNCAILRVVFGRLVGAPRTPRWAGHLTGLIAANVVMAGVAFFLWQAGIRLLADGADRLTGWLAAVWLGVTIGGGFLAYALCLKLVRYPGGEELLRMPRRFIARLGGRR